MGDERVWLDSLKAGDKVIFSNYGWGLPKQNIGTVVRRTKNFIIATPDGNEKYEHKFRCESGWEAGSGYHRSSLIEATKERLDAIRLAYLRYRTKNLFTDKIDWDKIPADILNQLGNLGKAFIKEGKEEVL